MRHADLLWILLVVKECFVVVRIAYLLLEKIAVVFAEFMRETAMQLHYFRFFLLGLSDEDRPCV